MIFFIKNNCVKFILATLLTVILSLNYFGFCYSQKRFLSDEEKLNIVVKEILTSEAERLKYYKHVISFDKNNERRIRLAKEYLGEPVPYRDINDFFVTTQPPPNSKGGLEGIKPKRRIHCGLVFWQTTHSCVF